MSNIVIALPKIEDAKRLRVILERHDLSVTSVCSTAANALSQVSVLDAGVLICSFRLPDMSFIELKECLNEDFEVIVLASPKNAGEIPESTLCINLPMRESELVGTVEMVLEQIDSKRRRLRKPRSRSRNEKECIAEAKLLLMKNYQYTEEEAYRYIQKTSMNTGNTMVRTAQIILEGINQI